MRLVFITLLLLVPIGCSTDKNSPESPGPKQDGKTLDRSKAESLYHEGTALLKSDPKAAIKLLTESLEYGPNAPPALYNRAVAYASIGMDSEAIADVNRLEKLDPEIGAKLRNRFAASAIPYVDIANSMMEADDYQAALAKFNSAITYDPSCIEAWIGKAKVLEQLKRTNEAAEAKRKVEQLEKSNLKK